ncbi:substrate-binding periplasmic protein [Magnetococcus sp. PR-3]|uniref:substrate-binding periplasmic protein n=1 Tax=Magnetococcus sp. PR-3 TaxID=3120355 RepID=UPI002FCE0090
MLCIIISGDLFAAHAQFDTTEGPEKIQTQIAQDEVTQIKARGYLRVAIYHRDTPPFYYKDELGVLQGFDVDLIKGFAALLGVKVVFVREPSSFNGLVESVAQGKADLALSKISRTFKRALRVNFSKPYLVMRQGLLINRQHLSRQQARNQPLGQWLRQTKGRLGVIGGSSYEQFAKTYFPHMEVVPFKAWDGALKAVSQGQILAAYRDELEIKKIISARPNLSITLKTVVLEDLKDAIVIAVNLNHPHLLSLINLYLENGGFMRFSPEEIIQNHMPKNVSHNQRTLELIGGRM